MNMLHHAHPGQGGACIEAKRDETLGKEFECPFLGLLCVRRKSAGLVSTAWSSSGGLGPNPPPFSQTGTGLPKLVYMLPVARQKWWARDRKSVV